MASQREPGEECAEWLDIDRPGVGMVLTDACERPPVLLGARLSEYSKRRGGEILRGGGVLGVERRVTVECVAGRRGTIVSGGEEESCACERPRKALAIWIAAAPSCTGNFVEGTTCAREKGTSGCTAT